MKFLTTHRNALIVIGIVVVLFVALRVLKKRRDEGFQAMLMAPPPGMVRRPGMAPPPGMVPRAPPPGVSPEAGAYHAMLESAATACKTANTNKDRLGRLMSNLHRIIDEVVRPETRAGAYKMLDSYINAGPNQIQVSDCLTLAKNMKGELSKKYPIAA